MSRLSCLWFMLAVTHLPTAQRLDLLACRNRTRDDECSFAGSLNTVRHGKCAEVGRVNDTKIACIPLSSGPAGGNQKETSPFDPHCIRGRLHSQSGACCPLECDNCIMGGFEVPDACSVEFILRLAPYCAVASPPCVAAATQGASPISPAGFLVTRASPEPSIVVSTSSGQESSSLDDANDAGPAVLIASVAGLCLCCWCWVLMCRSLRTLDREEPTATHTGKAKKDSSKSKSRATVDGQVKKKKKRKGKHLPRLDEIADEESQIFDEIGNPRCADTGAAESREYVDEDSTLPVPIIDIWQAAVKPAPAELANVTKVRDGSSNGEVNGSAKEFRVDSDSEDELDIGTLAAVVGSIRHYGSDQLHEVTPRRDSSAALSKTPVTPRRDVSTTPETPTTCTPRVHVVATALSDQAPGGQQPAQPSKDITWQRKWDNMQDDLTSALDDIDPPVPSSAPTRTGIRPPK